MKKCNKCSFDTTWTDEDGFYHKVITTRLLRHHDVIIVTLSSWQKTETEMELIVNDDFVNSDHLGDYSCFSPCIEFHFESLPG